MFRWYKQSAVCYAYLSDVERSANPSETIDNLSRSQWFTRGWTLQELIAPENVVFYSADWEPLGTKSQLRGLISTITGIDADYLVGKDLELASVSKRMSWAAKRSTSRVEDMAYCLLGIFNINMPLIYGEGNKAFLRLQKKILKAKPYDQTLFAWGDEILPWPIVNVPPTLFGAAEFERHGQALWSEQAAEEPLLGLFASSPRQFESSGEFISAHDDARDFYWGVGSARADGRSPRTHPQIMDHDVRLDLPCLPAENQGLSSTETHFVFQYRNVPIVQLRHGVYAVLFCCHADTRQGRVVLPLKACGSRNTFGRTRYLAFSSAMIPQAAYPFPGPWTDKSLVVIAPDRGGGRAAGERLLRRGDIVFRRSLHSLYRYYYWVNPRVEFLAQSEMVRAGLASGTLFSFCFCAERVIDDGCRGWIVHIGRDRGWQHAPAARQAFPGGSSETLVSSAVGSLIVAVMRVSLSNNCASLAPNDLVEENGLVWYGYESVRRDATLTAGDDELPSTDGIGIVRTRSGLEPSALGPGWVARRRMAAPHDVLELRAAVGAGIPDLRIAVERVELEGEGNVVDVIDVQMGATDAID